MDDADAVFLPYLGALYEVAPGWTVYASYTKIFEPQDEIGLDGGSLAPVRGTNVEAGVKGTLLGDRLLVAAACRKSSAAKNARRPRKMTKPVNCKLIFARRMRKATA